MTAADTDTFVETITNLLSEGDEAKALEVWDRVAREEDTVTVIEVHRRLADVGAIQQLVMTVRQSREYRERSETQRHDVWDMPDDY